MSFEALRKTGVVMGSAVALGGFFGNQAQANRENFGDLDKYCPPYLRGPHPNRAKYFTCVALLKDALGWRAGDGNDEINYSGALSELYRWGNSDRKKAYLDQFEQVYFGTARTEIEARVLSSPKWALAEPVVSNSVVLENIAVKNNTATVRSRQTWEVVNTLDPDTKTNVLYSETNKTHITTLKPFGAHWVVTADTSGQ